VIQGTLLVIPIGESLIYIRPLYLRASGGRITELKRVIVAHQNQIVMEETLEAALERIFPSGTKPPGETTESAPAAATHAPGNNLADLAIRAQEQYHRALQHQRDGNWALYGEEIKQLGETLTRMKP